MQNLASDINLMLYSKGNRPGIHMTDTSSKMGSPAFSSEFVQLKELWPKKLGQSPLSEGSELILCSGP